MWNDQFNSMLMLMVMAALLRVSYEMSRPKPQPSERVPILAATNPIKETRSVAITLKQKEWAEKAVKRYAEAQGKKWQHWNEAMFEVSK